jgi:hypothetical protein
MGAATRTALLGTCLIVFGAGLATVCIIFGLAQGGDSDPTETRQTNRAVASVNERMEGIPRESREETHKPATESFQRISSHAHQRANCDNERPHDRVEEHARSLGFASVSDFLAQVGSFEGFDNDPTIYCREKNIASLQRNLLSGTISLEDLDDRLSVLRLTREETLTPEFLAQLVADRERGRQQQLENIERLKDCPPWPLWRRPDAKLSVQEAQRQVAEWEKQTRELEPLHKAVELWAQQPLSEEVRAAVLAALQNRYARLSMDEAANDRPLAVLLSAAGAYCGNEGRELLRNLYYACSSQWLRVRFLTAYADTLGRTSRAADFLFQAMTSDPFQPVRSQAQESFEKILADASETWRWKGQLGNPEMLAIAQKYAGYKKEMLYAVINTGDPDKLVQVIGKLSGEVESDAGFLVEFARNSPHAEVRLAALAQLDMSEPKVMSLADRSAIYRELYVRKESSPHVRERCISALGSTKYIKNTENRALVGNAISDPDEQIRRLAERIIEDYEKSKPRFPDRHNDDE